MPLKVVLMGFIWRCWKRSNQQPVNFLPIIISRTLIKKAFKKLNLHFLKPNNLRYT